MDLLRREVCFVHHLLYGVICPKVVAFRLLGFPFLHKRLFLKVLFGFLFSDNKVHQEIGWILPEHLLLEIVPRRGMLRDTESVRVLV